MPRYYGKVGYSVTVEDPARPGVWIDEITERSYYGDVLRNSSKWSNGEGTNDNLSLSNRISIVADPYAYENFSRIKYIEFMGILWKVSSIDVERPRLILSLEDEWNGQ